MLRRIRKRYEAVLSGMPPLRLRPAAALRDVLSQGYGRADLRADVLAGVVVGIVALPLSMALAIAVGVPPQHGLYTAIVAGFVTSLLGGSRAQVTGPTAAFVVILIPISTKFGIGGLLVATLMAGMILVAFGVARLGKLMAFVSYPVTMGFTAGIGVVIATLQLKDFFGLEVGELPPHYVERLRALIEAMPTMSVVDAAFGACTLAVLIVAPRLTRRVPAPLIALALAGIGAYVVEAYARGVDVTTIGDHFSYLVDGQPRRGIPPMPPMPALPWELGGANGAHFELSWSTIRALFPSALAIALLGAIESLLSAVVADGMAGTKHDPDAELIAQGAGNIVAPFFGGFAATGAIARTATNIRAGARSPIAAATHAVFVLVSVLLLAPMLAFLPMSALAALLLVVAWNMSEVKHVVHIMRVAPKSDVLVLLTCFTLTVLFDMVIAVSVGVVLAAVLFMRRMAEISEARFAEAGRHPALREPLPEGVLLYEIAGPLFFGAAQKAMSSLLAVRSKARVLILDVTNVPVMDVTGLVALESTITRMKSAGTFVVLSGLQAQPKEVLERAEIEPIDGALVFAPTLEAAIEVARARLPSSGDRREEGANVDRLGEVGGPT